MFTHIHRLTSVVFYVISHSGVKPIHIRNYRSGVKPLHTRKYRSRVKPIHTRKYRSGIQTPGIQLLLIRVLVTILFTGGKPTMYLKDALT